ncbi:MAG: acyl-homoserine-lactone synthase LasI [Nevskia sp.]
MYLASCNALHDAGMSPVLVDQMFNLRYRVFHERLGWTVRCIGRHEIDEFDDSLARYVLVRDANTHHLCGSWRLRPTTAPYMLRDIFPELLDGTPPPKARNIWEISRLCIDRDAPEGLPVSLNDVVMELMKATAYFAAEKQIDQFVTVTTPSLVRLLTLAGIRVQRLGAPRLVGIVTSLACRIDVDARTRSILSEVPSRATLREAA